MIIVIL
jgi:hypothetical protein